VSVPTIIRTAGRPYHLFAMAIKNSFWIPIWILGRAGVLPCYDNLLIKRGLIAFRGVAKFPKDAHDWPEKGRAVTV
jgi:hypothetical protein